MDMEDCVVYIVFQLRTAGFEVKFTWPNLLYVSWKHHEAAYLESQNPIVQAMMKESKVAPVFASASTSSPLPQPKGGSQKKKGLPGPMQMPGGIPKSTVSFSDIDLITSMPPSAGVTFGSPPKRETSEYVPPDSFIQTMERPVRVLPSGQIIQSPGPLGQRPEGQPFNRTPSYGQRAQQQQHSKNSVLSDLWSS
jgi:hypothetical protein